jgi:hypothetical protein
MGNDIRIKLRLTREPQTVDEVLDAAYSDKDVCRTASKKALPDLALRAFVDRLAYRILALESRAANPVAAQEAKQANDKPTYPHDRIAMLNDRLKKLLDLNAPDVIIKNEKDRLRNTVVAACGRLRSTKD